MHTRDAEKFFYEHAGWSQRQGETSEQGRRRGARALAKAEAFASAKGWYVEWAPEQERYEDVYGMPAEQEEYYSAVLRDEDGEFLESLGFVDDTNPRGYGRVVEAELALAAMLPAMLREPRRTVRELGRRLPRRGR